MGLPAHLCGRGGPPAGLPCGSQIPSYSSLGVRPLRDLVHHVTACSEGARACWGGGMCWACFRSGPISVGGGRGSKRSAPLFPGPQGEPAHGLHPRFVVAEIWADRVQGGGGGTSCVQASPNFAILRPRTEECIAVPSYQGVEVGMRTTRRILVKPRVQTLNRSVQRLWVYHGCMKHGCRSHVLWPFDQPECRPPPLQAIRDWSGLCCSAARQNNELRTVAMTICLCHGGHASSVSVAHGPSSYPPPLPPWRYICAGQS